MVEDPAFVWERALPGGRGERERAGGVAAPEGYGPASQTFSARESEDPMRGVEHSWVTLRHAEAVTGVRASTVRNWARKGRIPTKIENRQEGPVRLVGIEAVTLRARKLGRLHPPPQQKDGAPQAPSPEGEAVVDLRPQPARTEDREHRGPVPDGQMLVPLDAWERMLMQLGNLHEAGQQLADARERAAKAETEARFLRERVADLRLERDRLRSELTESEVKTPPAPWPEPQRPPTRVTSVGRWQQLYRTWIARRTLRGRA